MAYLLSFARRGSSAFTVVDALIVVAIMGIATAMVMPLLDAAGTNAKSVVLRQNLQTLRCEIERYKLDHRNELPLVFRGGFPQLEQATNVAGVPGPPGRNFPFGAYLPQGVPINPYTHSNEVRLTDKFPPTQATGGGWLYHQATGRITADVPEFLNQ
jgi:type II secretory pathway pseudopilin PulG